MIIVIQSKASPCSPAHTDELACLASRTVCKVETFSLEGHTAAGPNSPITSCKVTSYNWR